jgi:hypothetical protein
VSGNAGGRPKGFARLIAEEIQEGEEGYAANVSTTS